MKARTFHVPLIPFSIAAIKGDEESRKKCAAWAELWSEMVPSTETAVRLYGEEIVEAAMEILKENQVWAVRAQVR